MRYLTSSIFSVLFVLLLSGCKKDNPQRPPDNNPPAYKYLLKSIEWDNGTVATMHYNNDSSIKYIDYVYQPLTEILNFSWVGKNMVNMAYGSSLYMNIYNYNNGRLVSVVNSFKDLRLPNGYKFEYAYHANGSLSELKYSTINEAGTNLITTTTYDYKTNGELQSVTTTQLNNIKIKYTIESWSEVCVFNPWIYVPAALSEYYQLYNYPVLSKLNKLPGKVTQTIIQAGVPDRVEKVEQNVYTITNERLDKTVTTLSYPGSPELDQTRTAVFKY